MGDWSPGTRSVGVLFVEVWEIRRWGLMDDIPAIDKVIVILKWNYMTFNTIVLSLLTIIISRR